MNRLFTLALLATTFATVGLAKSDAAPPYSWPVQRSWCYDWNKPYRHTAYGQTVALVVPPTATMQTNWGWGVGSSRVQRLDHQFGRAYPGNGRFGGGRYTTPVWPSDTTQFGVYSVRGPW